MEKLLKTKIRNRLSILINTLLLIILVLVAFYPSFDNAFISWDDQFYVTSNPLLNNPSWDSLKQLSNRVVSLNYHPLTMLSLWVNAWYSGVETASFFIKTNVIIHIVNTLLVCLFIYQLSNRSLITAFSTALIFAIHPMHVESVVWVSERKDVLYSFFFLGALLFYWNYLKRNSSTLLALSILFFLLSCLSKAMAVSLVPCLFLLDYMRSRNLYNYQLYLEKIPFVLMALFFGSIAINVQGGGDFHGFLSLSESANAIALEDFSVTEKLINSSFANFYYIKNFFLPAEHSPFHPYSLKNTYDPFLYFSVTILVFALLLIAIKNNWRGIVFGIAFYFSTIALVLQFLPVGSAIVAERYTYLPYLGLAYIVSLGLEKLWNLRQQNVLCILLTLLSAYFIVNTRIQSNIWQNHVSLFQQAVEQYPEDPFSRITLASGLWESNKIDEAIHHVEYAINKLGLLTSSAFELLANCYSEKGETEKAIAFFNEAVRLDDGNIIARYHRGLELIEINPHQAIKDFNRCEASNNEYVIPLLYSPRGRAYGLTRDYENALSDLNKAIEYFPNDVNNYLDKAITLEKLNRFEEAKQVYRQALSLNQNESLAIERLNILTTTKI